MARGGGEGRGGARRGGEGRSGEEVRGGAVFRDRALKGVLFKVFRVFLKVEAVCCPECFT